jgi:tripartite-type tricarboxylate transporter receptor subunit TctC
MVQRLAICFALLLAVAGGVQAAQRGSPNDTAAGYPTRPIRLIIPFPPGGSNDIMGRYFALYLTERLGKQVVVDNRAGADGIIGTEIASRAQPDGHTLLIASAAFAVNGATRKVPYDPLKSFSWVGTVGYGPSVLSVGPALKVNSAKELIAYGQANPGKLTLATSGGFAQFASELFNHLSGMKMLVVIYKGGFPALVDVMGGQAHVNLGSLIQTLPHLKSGRLKALATSGSRRATAAPELPTIAESGVTGYEANNWWAIAVPAGTPPGVIKKLSEELKRYLEQPSTLKRFQAEGVEADFRTPAEVHKMIPVEMAKWKNVAKVANIGVVN